MRRRRAGAILAGLVIVVAALVPVSAEAAVPSVTSLSGADRYATSAAISAASFSPGVAVAYVASGAAFPDALSGAAGGRGAAPVLLTRTDDLPSSIAQELTRLAPRRIVVLGGTGTVSDTVVAALGAYTTGTVTRIAGADRYETSAAISLAAFPAGAPVAYLASGETYPDALSGAAVAAMAGGPVLLTQGATLPTAIATELARLRPGRIVVLGGEGAVSEDVAAAAAAAAGGVTVSRLSGADRFATSAAVSAATFAPGAPVVYVASGTDFADALTGAAAVHGAPLLLTLPDAVPDATARELLRLAPERIVVLGGTGAVSATVRTRLATIATVLPAATGGKITTTTEVPAGSCLSSPNTTYRVCVRTDIGFGVFRGTTALWTSETPDAQVRALRVGTDGSATLYTIDGRAIWQSSTSGSAGRELVMQDDGDLSLRTTAGAVLWSTMTSPASPTWNLPFAAGQRWAAGGPHSNNGDNVGPRGSIDFGPVTAGASIQVRAIAPGTVYKITCSGGSYLGINHANGWQSTYYHIVNLQTQLVGTYVAAGTYLGDVGEATSCGGGASFDHVHLTIRRAGAPVSVEGMTFGGYRMHSSGKDYWGYWTNAAGTRVLTAPGGAACCLAAQ
ncbi:MAG: cell wall-binding repeat-containing protein [Microbacterium sp.]|nr:cell wall-binding repeat-containing protein [Microbacterium sp.]